MRNPTREELLAVIAELSTVWPEMRFGQMIAALTMVADPAPTDRVYDVEDEQLLAAAREQLKYFQEHRSAVA